MTRRFVSGFVIQTDAKFNTNEFHKPLSILLEVPNTLSSFHVTFYFILSKSTDVFIFIHACCKEIFF